MKSGPVDGFVGGSGGHSLLILFLLFLKMKSKEKNIWSEETEAYSN